MKMMELLGGLLAGGMLGYYAKEKIAKKNVGNGSLSLEEENKRLKKRCEELQSRVEQLQNQLKMSNTSVPEVKRSEDFKPQISAKEDVIKNITLLTPMLQNLLDGTFQAEHWDDVIIDINNAELNSLWEKIRKKPESILRIFAVWGIRPDLCKSFVCMGDEIDLYSLEPEGQIQKGMSYDVTSHCWLLTMDDGSKKIIVKGKVKQKKE